MEILKIHWSSYIIRWPSEFQVKESRGTDFFPWDDSWTNDLSQLEVLRYKTSRKLYRIVCALNHFKMVTRLFWIHLQTAWIGCPSLLERSAPLQKYSGQAQPYKTNIRKKQIPLAILQIDSWCADISNPLVLVCTSMKLLKFVYVGLAWFNSFHFSDMNEKAQTEWKNLW
jgi:hypothetical protein